MIKNKKQKKARNYLCAVCALLLISTKSQIKIHSSDLHIIGFNFCHTLFCNCRQIRAKRHLLTCSTMDSIMWRYESGQRAF